MDDLPSVMGSSANESALTRVQRQDDTTPWLGAHYRPFNATTGRSVPVPRIGTQALAITSLGPLPQQWDDRFKGSVSGPDPRSRRLKAGCHGGRIAGPAATAPGTLSIPRFRHRLI